MVIEQHLDPKRAMPNSGGDLIDVLIGHWKEHRGFTRDHVKAIIFVRPLANQFTSSMIDRP
jgi:4-hydroxyphenylacetaldehyde oxime monooxygenase